MTTHIDDIVFHCLEPLAPGCHRACQREYTTFPARVEHGLVLLVLDRAHAVHAAHVVHTVHAAVS